MNILSIGIHMDDCEYGMGGTANLLAQRGHKVTFLNIKPYMHYKGRFPAADAQSTRAAEILGAQKVILDYTGTKYYVTNEQTVRQTEEVIRQTRPDILFIMHPRDNHIEHVECAKTAREAIFAAAVDQIGPNEIYTYECGPNQTMQLFTPDLYINIDPCAQTVRQSLFTFAQDHASGEGLWREKQVCASFRGHSSGFPLAEGVQDPEISAGQPSFPAAGRAE